MRQTKSEVIYDARPSHTRLPKRVIVWIAAWVLLFVTAAAIYTTIRDTIDPQIRAERLAAAQRDSWRAERLSWADDIFYVGMRLLPFFLAGLGGLIAYRRWGTPTSVEAGYRVRELQAIHQPGQTPQQIHYAPHMRPIQTTPAAPLLPATIQDDQDTDDPDTPTMTDLIQAGRVGRGNPLVLGYESGQELTGSWLDLYATITAGLPGSGKTTTQRFYACQTALHGARFAVGDPHAGAADDSLAATLEPLRSIYLCEPASDPKAILEVVKYVADIGEKRVKGLDHDRTPIVLWLDEMTGLLGRSDVGSELAELLERIAQEYRKRWVYLSASGQIWTAARATSELRDSFASVVCHRMKRSQARLLLPTEEAGQVERLSTGSAVLWRTSGATSVITIPNTTAADVQHVAGLLTADQPTMQALARPPLGYQRPPIDAGDLDQWKPDGSQTVAIIEQASVAVESVKTVSAEAARAAALFRAGNDPATIVKELRGISSSSGRKYQQALTEVLQLIREGI